MAAIARAARLVLPRRTAARTLALARNTEDAEHIAFPREGPGLDYALNWSLNGDGVTPSAQAFRLTKASAAAKLLGKKPAKPSGKGAAAPEIDDEDAFDDAFDDVAEALEAAPALYVSEGDAPATRTPCRVITDDLKLGATAMAHCLERMPLRPPVELPITAYVAPAAADFAGYVTEDDRVKIVLGGKSATAAALKASLEACAGLDLSGEAPPELDEA